MEFFYNLKKNILLIALKICILSVFFILLYIFLSFLFSSNQAINKNFSDEKNKNLYSITDTLTNPDQFSEFRESKESLINLANFYNELNQNKNLLYISSFDQPIPVIDFKGDSTFQKNYGTQLDTDGPYKDDQSGYEYFDIKSIQMNQNMYKFFNLKTEDGRELKWDEITYAGNKIPILLGNDYKEFYQLGETIIGDFYFEKMEFEIIGFLEKNSSIFFQNELNFFVDNYLIIPYPTTIGEFSEKQQFFSGILYFAMFNGDIVADKKLHPSSIINELTKISEKSTFFDYTLIALPTYLTQFNLVRNLITRNVKLLRFIFFMTLLIIISLNLFINKQLFNRKKPKYFVMKLKGESSVKIASSVLWDTLFESFGVAISFFFMFLLLPIKEQNSFYLTFLILFIYLLIDLACSYSLYKLEKRQIVFSKEDYFD